MRIPFVFAFGIAIAAIAPPAVATDASFDLLVRQEGSVQLKRAGWQNFRPVEVGATLHSRDRLFVPPGARAGLWCRDRSFFSVPTGVEVRVDSGCPAEGDRVVLRAKPGSATELDPRIPYVISPRNTVVLNRQPTLRWNPVSGATSYVIQMRGTGVSWAIQTSATEVTYPGNPPLQPGARYRIIVTSDNGFSSISEGIVGFVVVSDREAQQVRNLAKQLQERQLGEDVEPLVLASLYRNKELYAEAIALLEASIRDRKPRAATYQLLGELYQQVGLNQLAKEPYEQALALARASGDSEGAAAIQTGLGEMEVALGNLEAAIAWFEQAQSGYQRLGDRTQADAIAQRLASLQ